jgi:hypothetical protein
MRRCLFVPVHCSLSFFTGVVEKAAPSNATDSAASSDSSSVAVPVSIAIWAHPRHAATAIHSLVQLGEASPLPSSAPALDRSTISFPADLSGVRSRVREPDATPSPAVDHAGVAGLSLLTQHLACAEMFDVCVGVCVVCVCSAPVSCARSAAEV